MRCYGSLWNAWRVALALASTVSVLPSLARAYPIPPASLRHLINDATLIAVVDVKDVEQRRPPPQATSQPAAPQCGLDTDPVAVLRVRETLKGSARAFDELRVAFPGGLACPAPPRYTPGETIVVFLAPSRRDPNHLETCSLSYGARPLPDAAARKAYTDRVREYLGLIGAAEPEARKAALLGWLVRCVEEPATRWDGAFDLCRAFEPADSWHRERIQAAPKDLSLEQRARLVAAYLARDREAGKDYDLTKVVNALVDCRQIERRLRDIRGADLRTADGRQETCAAVREVAADVGLAEGFALADRLADANDRATQSGKPLPPGEVNALRTAVHDFRVVAEQRLRLLRRGLGVQ